MAPPVNIILGAGTIGDSAKTPLAKFDSPEQVNPLLDLLYERGIRQIDTARGYAPLAPGSSEQRLGAVEAGKRFAIDSKALFTGPGDTGMHSKDKVRESVRASLEALGQAQVNVYYLHAPDRATPFEDAHEALDEAFRAGHIKQFGISNHTPEEVEQFVARANTKGLVAPTVYQGHYNPIVRGGEKELFPLLRKHGIAFYAYSPSAGGLFAGNLKKGTNRWDKSHMIGSLYSQFYDKPQFAAAVEKVEAAAAKHNISGHAAALRWTAYHSALDASLGDAVIIGGSRLEQLKENVDIIEAGPLPEELAQAVEDVFQHVGDAAIKPWF